MSSFDEFNPPVFKAQGPYSSQQSQIKHLLHCIEIKNVKITELERTIQRLTAKYAMEEIRLRRAIESLGTLRDFATLEDDRRDPSSHHMMDALRYGLLAKVNKTLPWWKRTWNWIKGVF